MVPDYLLAKKKRHIWTVEYKIWWIKFLVQDNVQYHTRNKTILK